MSDSGITKYSELVAGDAGNYEQPVQFDITDGYVGITQSHKNLTDRVLLSPKQTKALTKFIKQRR